ncbi:MAG: hypothetical protein JO336_04165 [Acidobacteriia bacterium]|nr:hypothetical protein [Terriglobia bacterium]
MKNVNSIFAFVAGTALVAASASAQVMTVNQAIDSFTHLARIPAGANLATIKFQSVKVVKVPTRKVVSTDSRYCEAAAMREPGGSMFCASVQTEGYTRAYQVTYSYEGQAMASDESGNRRFTFSVYFRPEELTAGERSLFERKASRSDAEASFQVTTSRELETKLTVDNARSTFCEGMYIDGRWMHNNTACVDSVQFKAVAVPSDYMTVRVDPVQARVLASVVTGE